MPEMKDKIPVNDIINTILDKKFRKIGRDGYSNTEVDAFLDAICDAVEELQSNMERLRQQANEAQAAQRSLQLKLTDAHEEINQLKARPAAAAAPVAAAPVAAPAAGTEDAMELLMMAQKLKAETLANAQAKADQMLAEAQKNAEAQLGDLSEERSALVQEVTSLKNAIKEYKEKLAAMVAQTKAIIDSAE